MNLLYVNLLYVNLLCHVTVLSFYSPVITNMKQGIPLIDDGRIVVADDVAVAVG